jgi:lipid II:glycine glycyltransferase (peptidoglycan interpeptide bridge formation enzyme)
MEYKVIVNELDEAQWESYACEFADYNIYQTWAYQEVRARMDHQEVARVVVKDASERVVTMAQIRVKRVRPVGLAIGYVQRGPLLHDRSGAVVGSAEAVEQLWAACGRLGINTLRIVPNVVDDETGRVFAGMLGRAGFSQAKQIRPFRTFVLPVHDSADEIRERLHKSFRRDLKKAEKTGLEIQCSSEEGACEVLGELYHGLIDRKGFQGLDFEEFAGTQRLLPDREKMDILIARLGQEPVGALLMSCLGDTALVLLAATNDKALTCCASYLLWYTGAVRAGQKGMKKFDTGGIDPDENPGVFTFKSRMGGQETLHIGAFDVCSTAARQVVWRLSERVYRLVHR